MAASSPRARPPISAPTRKSARPTWANKRLLMAERLLEVSNIETRYGLSQVLFGISLAISPGEMVTLMGRNGMGKTTTGRSIMGLSPARAGSIRFGGGDISG